MQGKKWMKSLKKIGDNNSYKKGNLLGQVFVNQTFHQIIKGILVFQKKGMMKKTVLLVIKITVVVLMIYQQIKQKMEI